MVSRLIEVFEVTGSDGNEYEVHFVELPGPMFRPLNGPAREGRGPREYRLSDGRTLFDVDRHEWEIKDTDVRLPKPPGA